MSLTDKLDKRTKKAVEGKLKNLQACVTDVEKLSGLKYPRYYIEPVLAVAESNDNVGGLGVLYARTIPVEVLGRVEILVEVTAPLLLYATKGILRLVLAHEFLHYLELVRNFMKLDVVSNMTSSSLYEERHTDYSRALNPSHVFSNKRLVSNLKKQTSIGLEDEKLNEKCKARWIERGLPMTKVALAMNQSRISISAIMQSQFDPDAMALITKIL
ncbi:MAG: hypothetical protein JRN67_12785 [Nitrososphaerota archaeon]|nr:hypothetical protein [Nitrososphaerota archaeon]